MQNSIEEIIVDITNTLNPQLSFRKKMLQIQQKPSSSVPSPLSFYSHLPPSVLLLLCLFLLSPLISLLISSHNSLCPATFLVPYITLLSSLVPWEKPVSQRIKKQEETFYSIFPLNFIFINSTLNAT